MGLWKRSQSLGHVVENDSLIPNTTKGRLMKLRNMLSKSFSIPDVVFVFPFGFLASFDFDSCSALISPHLTAKVLDKGASSANVLVWSDPH